MEKELAVRKIRKIIRAIDEIADSLDGYTNEKAKEYLAKSIENLDDADFSLRVSMERDYNEKRLRNKELIQ